MKKLLLLPLLIVLPLSLTACKSGGGILPRGAGAGLINVSPKEAPAGAETFARPDWKVGERFVYLLARKKQLHLRVVAADEKGYRLQNEDTGQLRAYDKDLGFLSRVQPGRPETLEVRAPVDTMLHWPLWVGKQWTCVHMEKSPQVKEVLEIMVTYEVDAVETIKVPAGEFRCLRVWRRSRLQRVWKGEKAEAVDYRNTALYWYAPEVGFWARYLVDGIETDLIGHQRQVQSNSPWDQGPHGER